MTMTTSVTTIAIDTAKCTSLYWKIQRQGTNLFILSILVLFTIDVAPFAFMKSIRDIIDAPLDKIGLWQGPYHLYSPDVKKESIRLSAKIKYHKNPEVDSTAKSNKNKHKNEKIQIWKSVDASGIRPLQKKRNFRKYMYIDYVRLDENKVLWEPLAEHLVKNYLKKQMQHNQTVLPSIAQIYLYRHWIDVNLPPTTNKFFDKVKLDYTLEKSYQFYTLKYDTDGLKYDTNGDD